MEHRSRSVNLITAVIVLAIVCAVLAGCTSWEQNTFATLKAAQSVINAASTDYNAGVIPKTQGNYNLLQKAQQTKDLAVRAFQAYWDVKTSVEQGLASGDITKSEGQARLQAAQLTAQAVLKDLPGLVAQVEQLKGH